jgi:molybdenum cofactor cytidylyltransferase
MGIHTAISVIILAAGESKRMGKMKQLLPLGHTTILEQVVDNFLSSKAEEVIVVVGHKGREIIKKIGQRPIKIVLNPLYNQGMSTSIISGLGLVSKKAQGIMLALGDQPFINSSTINSLIEVFCRHNRNIIIPVFQGKRGHPVIFSEIYREHLLALNGDFGGREVIARSPGDVLEVKVMCCGVINDIDTPKEYYSLLKDSTPNINVKP